MSVERGADGGFILKLAEVDDRSIIPEVFQVTYVTRVLVVGKADFSERILGRVLVPCVRAARCGVPEVELVAVNPTVNIDPRVVVARLCRGRQVMEDAQVGVTINVVPVKVLESSGTSRVRPRLVLADVGPAVDVVDQDLILVVLPRIGLDPRPSADPRPHHPPRHRRRR